MGNTKLIGIAGIIGLFIYLLSELWWIILIFLGTITVAIFIVHLLNKAKDLDKKNNDKLLSKSDTNNNTNVIIESQNEKLKEDELYKANQLKRYEEILNNRKSLFLERNKQLNQELEEFNVSIIELSNSSIFIEFPYLSDFNKILSIIRNWSIDTIQFKVNTSCGKILEKCHLYEGVNKLGYTEFYADFTILEKIIKDSVLEKIDDKVSKYIYCLCRNKYIFDSLNTYSNILNDIVIPEVSVSKNIEDYITEILKNSRYNDSFDKEFEIFYSNNMLLVNYQLPSIDDYPKVKEYKYNFSGNTISEMKFSDIFISQSYENTLYSICLRCLFEIFSSDYNDNIKTITFNGFVESVNKALGKKERKCILSVQTNKEFFLEIELANVNPKLCFRNMKGVSASKLIDITPIIPVLSINREDKRFVESKDVQINNETNLASMDWEEFEHLVRTLFEKEFSSNGGEVKVTQASRDGGVDAIIFDSDPLRGGKIIIQAKRYTNTVGVSAVRDLYGTVINEGANSGILITTSDFGADSYTFAKNKPIKLLNGGHLLALLDKHGQKARINIEEARNNMIS